MVRKKDLDYIVVGALLVTGLYTLISGAIAEWFGFPRFLFHSYAGYACAILGAAHLSLKWPEVKAYVRRRLRKRRLAEASQEAGEARREAAAARPEEAASSRRTRAPFLGRRALLASGFSAAGGFVLGRLAAGRREVELPYGAADIGETYHAWSKPGYSQTLGTTRDWGGRPDQLKAYPEAERIALPEPQGWQGLSTAEAIETRRSQRTYASGPLPLEDLSRLLHAASGMTDLASGFRAAPSAGALYPIETYAVVHDVAGLEAGLYHYAPTGHELERLRSGDLRLAMVVAGIGQEMLARAQVCLALSAVFQRTRWRYHERAYRYILLEAGHIAQNIYLAATALGLGACAVGAFLDDDLNRMLRIDGKDEAALCILTVGRL